MDSCPQLLALVSSLNGDAFLKRSYFNKASLRSAGIILLIQRVVSPNRWQHWGCRPRSGDLRPSSGASATLPLGILSILSTSATTGATLGKPLNFSKKRLPLMENGSNNNASFTV